MIDKTLQALFCTLGLMAASLAWAGNVDLATVPGRDGVQLTIYNSEDLTLVRETRTMSFRRGANALQFSWANTLIDPTSVELRFPGGGEGLVVEDTTFPHDRPQTLYWNVRSDFDGEAVVEITYFTSGISWSADYLVVAAAGEAEAALSGFVRVHNRSGEDYAGAQVRVVVGTINLVEKIAALARVTPDEVVLLEADRRKELRHRAAKALMAPMSARASADEVMAEKAIIKEGLSEYFIYTIEGTETIPNGWSKRLRSFAATAVPMEVHYRFRTREYGTALARLFLLRNDEASGLGTTPLPDGRVRVLGDDGDGRLRFLADLSIPYVPVGDRLELNLGADPRVVFELVKLRSSRDNIWLKLGRGEVYRRVDGDTLQVDQRGKVAGWDRHRIYAQRIRNYTDRDIRVEVRRVFRGDTDFVSGFEARGHDYQTVEFEARVAAGERRELVYEVMTRMGRNAKQNRVKIRRQDVPRPAF